MKPAVGRGGTGIREPGPGRREVRDGGRPRRRPDRPAVDQRWLTHGLDHIDLIIIRSPQPGRSSQRRPPLPRQPPSVAALERPTTPASCARSRRASCSRTSRSPTWPTSAACRCPSCRFARPCSWGCCRCPRPPTRPHARQRRHGPGDLQPRHGGLEEHQEDGGPRRRQHVSGLRTGAEVSRSANRVDGRLGGIAWMRVPTHPRPRGLAGGSPAVLAASHPMRACCPDSEPPTGGLEVRSGLSAGRPPRRARGNLMQRGPPRSPADCCWSHRWSQTWSHASCPVWPLDSA